MRRLFAAALLALPIAGPTTAIAQPEAQASSWGLGLGVGYERRAYRDFDNRARVLPLLMYENRWVSVAGPGIDLKLPDVGPLALRLRARYAFDGYEADDSPYLAGMAERKGGVWVGGALAWQLGATRLSAELLGDASGNSKGRQFRLQAEHSFRAGDFELTPRLAALSLDRKYVDYYYGVALSEQRAGRAAHAGESTVNTELGLRVGYRLASQQLLMLDLSGTRLGRGIKASPLVERGSETGLRMAYLYRF
ncbi:MipA/OmpV family protein [Roseateles sp. DAIF2]|uniref:MipA/OmpV family protein n=1 Tax=Roseateles sp. DAIF2 TaxID=2714952 RepID=UPI0018A2ECFB|nr:MipA/OmpV family protein [Roseateles sp. DAIF2]QPF72239.1 MipA/OmpV family protein [Roseateles sp. DAIF2]